MVVIKQYSNTQISELNSLTGRVLYDSTLNVLRFNDSASYNNILLFKDTSNNVTGLNNVRTTGNFGINTSSADKQAEINSATGDCLRLTYNDNNGSATNYSDFLVSSTGDLTITPSGGDITLNSSVSVSNNLSITGPTLKIPVGNTAARPASPEVGYIRYNSQTSQFEGYGAGNAWGSLGGVSDVDQNTKILAEDGAGTNDNNLRFFNDGNESMRLTAGSLMGLGTTAPDKKLEINSATGDCLRLTYNDNNGSAANYVDLLVSSGGDFNITPSGNDTTFNSTMTITGATSISSTLGVTGATTLSNTTDATTSTVGGALSIAGGAGIAKKLFVGTDLAVGGNSSLTGTLGVTGATTLSSTLGVTGATTLSSTLGVTGATTLSNTTDATSSTVGGSLTVAGGAAIAKKLYVGTDITGASMIFSSSETGNLDANAFDTITQYSRTATPSFIYDSYYNLAFNSDRSYWTSNATKTGTVSAGSVLTNYQTAAGFNGSSVNSSNPLCTLNDGNLLFTTRFNTSTSQYAAGLLLGTKTALTSVLWSGNLQDSGTASITSIAAKNINNIVFLTNDSKMFYTTNGSTFIENTIKPTGISYDTLSGSSLVWASGFNMFLIGLSSGSGIAYSSNGITWTNATTPSNANRSYIYYNPILNKAFAYNTGTNTLLVTSNGTNWTSSTLPSLTGTTFGQFLNNTHTGLVAIYPDPGSSVKNLIYSVDGTTWNTKLITSTSSIPGNSWLFSKENIVVFSNNVAFWSLLNTGWQIALTSSLVSEANIFKLNYLSGYLANQSKTGYQWYSSSTNSSVGTKIMEIDNQLDVNVPQYITDATNSTSSSTGSLRIAGGVGIAKDVNIGQAINVTGATTLSSTLSVTGAATFSSTLGVTGATTLSNTTDATSSTVGGSLTVAGGAGIAKKLFVGTDFAVGGNSSLTGSLGVTGATTLSSTLNITGATTLSNTTDATSSTVGGSLTVAGGAGIAKKLFVGTDFAAGGNSSLTGTLGVTGATTLSSTLSVTDATTLSSTLGVTGATTLSSTLGVTGAVTLSNTLGVTGVVTLSDATDATSNTAGGCLTIAGGTAIAKKLFVGGNSSLSGTLGVTGATTLSSTLSVTDATTLSSTLGVTGATTLSSTLGVTGAVTLSNTLGVTGVVTLSDATDATSNTAGGCLTIAGGTAIAKKLFVGGNSSLSGTLGVTGATTLSSTLSVTDATTLSSTLGVTGATLLSSTLGVTGATSLISTLSVNGAISFADTTDATSNTAGGCLTIAGGTAIAKKLFVGGNSSLTGTLGVTGATTLSSTLGVTGATTLSSTLGVTGATTLSSTLGVTGVVSLNNTTDATSSTVGGSLTLAGGAGIAKKLFVGTDFAVGGNSSLTGTLAVTGNSVLTGSLGVGTSAPDKKVEINSSTGDCLRLTNNDSDGTAANYADMLVSSTGNLTITPSGGDVNISSHNGSSTGLKLNNVLVTSTAAELNYNDTTVGIGAANKAVILDSNRNFVNLNYVEIDELAVIKTNSANNIIVHPLSLYAVPSTAAAIGLGTGIEFNSVNDTDQIYNAGYINYVSSNITTNSETGFLDFKVANSGSINSVATISNNGVLSVTSLVETSDVRSKENIQETLSSDSLEKILNVNVKTYNYIKDHEKRHHIGVIAQEIKEIIPESVIISKNDDFEDFHQVQYTSLVPHLINCIKVLNEEIKELKAKLN